MENGDFHRRLKNIDTSQHTLLIQNIEKIKMMARDLDVQGKSFHSGGPWKDAPEITNRQKWPPLPVGFKNVPEILVKAMRLREKIRSIKIGKKKIKLLLFAEDLIIHPQNQ